MSPQTFLIHLSFNKERHIIQDCLPSIYSYICLVFILHHFYHIHQSSNSYKTFYNSKLFILSHPFSESMYMQLAFFFILIHFSVSAKRLSRLHSLLGINLHILLFVMSCILSITVLGRNAVFTNLLNKFNNHSNKQATSIF